MRIIILCLFLLASLFAENPINLSLGDTQRITSNSYIQNISIGNPEVISVMFLSKKELLISGKKIGLSTLSVWNNEQKIDYQVVISKASAGLILKTHHLQNFSLIKNSLDDPDEMRKVNSEPIKENIKDLETLLLAYLEPSSFSISPWNSSVLVIGSEQDHQNIDKVLAQLDSPRKQILLEIEVYEVKNERSIADQLSATFGKDHSLKYDEVITDVSGKYDKNDGGFSYTFNSKGYTDAGSIAEYTTHIIKKLESEGKAKIIAKPNILTQEDKHAYIHSGEKIPVERKDAQGNVSVEYLPTGVILGFIPRVDNQGNVDCWLSTQVSSISGYDPKNNNPIIGTRETVSQIKINDNETLVLGGLLKDSETINSQKIPILGDLLGWIPFIGSFFKNESREKSTTELIIKIKPVIIGKK